MGGMGEAEDSTTAHLHAAAQAYVKTSPALARFLATCLAQRDAGNGASVDTLDGSFCPRCGESFVDCDKARASFHTGHKAPKGDVQVTHRQLLRRSGGAIPAHNEAPVSRHRRCMTISCQTCGHVLQYNYELSRKRAQPAATGPVIPHATSSPAPLAKSAGTSPSVLGGRGQGSSLGVGKAASKNRTRKRQSLDKMLANKKRAETASHKKTHSLSDFLTSL